MLTIYSVLVFLAVVAMMPRFCVRLVREPAFKERLRQSFGLIGRNLLAAVAKKSCIWIHDDSVGEVVAAAPIIKEIRTRFPDKPILLSVITATGREIATKIVEGADSIVFLPFDLPWLSKSIVKKIRPALFIIVETELWPNLLHYLHKNDIKIIMVNGRISEKSRVQYGYVRPFMRKTLAKISKFCMQSKIDASNIIEIGADNGKVVVTGNSKYEQSYPTIESGERADLIDVLGLQGRTPVFVAGSTYAYEEQLLCKAFKELQREFPAAIMVLAPRRIARAAEVQNFCSKEGLVCALRTTGCIETNADVVVLDTIGELGRVYSLADFVFVGGSMIERGGHNILEPAAYGKAIITGMHTFNFQEINAVMVANNACIKVATQEELQEAIIKLATNKGYRECFAHNATRIVNENRGAAKRNVDEIEKLIRGRNDTQKNNTGVLS